MSIERSFPVSSRPRLEVRLHSGRIDVEEGKSMTIELVIQGRGAEDVEVTHLGDTVTVRQLPESGWMRGGSIRVFARVPEGADLDLSGAAVEMWVSGTMGGVSIKTASGDVSIERATRVEAKTASGDLKIGGVDRDLVISSASGDVWIESAGGKVSVSLVSGDLRVGQVDGDLRVNTASGEVRVQRCGGSDITIKSISGDVMVGIPAGTRVEADISTLSGWIRTPERTLSSGEPQARVRLRVKSVSGGIELARA